MNDDILTDPERLAFWLLDEGLGTKSTTLEGLLEDFAAAGGLEACGISEDAWKAAYDKTWEVFTQAREEHQS